MCPVHCLIHTPSCVQMSTVLRPRSRSPPHVPWRGWRSFPLKMPGGLFVQWWKMTFQTAPPSPCLKRQHDRWDPLTLKHPPLGYCTVTYLSVCTWYVSFSWTSVSENVTVKCTLGKWVNIRREILFQENKSLIKPEKCSRIQWGLFLFYKKIYTSPGKKPRICIRTFF